jgi:hypothetical protein
MSGTKKDKVAEGSKELRKWVIQFLPLTSFPKRLLNHDHPFKAGIKSLRATLPDEIFYWGFCFLNSAFR